MGLETLLTGKKKQSDAPEPTVPDVIVPGVGGHKMITEVTKRLQEALEAKKKGK